MSRLARGSVTGMAWNLHNNLWNTNYPLYYPFFDSLHCPEGQPLKCKNANALFRFKMTFCPGTPSSSSSSGSGDGGGGGGGGAGGGGGGGVGRGGGVHP